MVLNVNKLCHYLLTFISSNTPLMGKIAPLLYILPPAGVCTMLEIWTLISLSLEKAICCHSSFSSMEKPTSIDQDNPQHWIWITNLFGSFHSIITSLCPSWVFSCDCTLSITCHPHPEEEKETSAWKYSLKHKYRLKSCIYENMYLCYLWTETAVNAKFLHWKFKICLFYLTLFLCSISFFF